MLSPGKAVFKTCSRPDMTSQSLGPGGFEPDKNIKELAATRIMEYLFEYPVRDAVYDQMCDSVCDLITKTSYNGRQGHSKKKNIGR